MGYQQISPKDLKARIERGDALVLIDVREEMEHEIAGIAGARLLPLSLFDEWAHTLSPEEETVVICHHGIRSAQVCAFLSRQGFDKLYNLSGGIDRWSREVDPNVPLY